MTTRKRFTRIATLAAVFESPILVWYFHHQHGYPWRGAVALTLLTIGAFRACVDILLKNLLEHPNLFENNSKEERDDDARYKRRVSFWVHKAKWAALFLGYVVTVWGTARLIGHPVKFGTVFYFIPSYLHGNISPSMLFQLPMLFFFNFIIFMGPMMLMGVSQIRAYEPGDATWGVKLDDVRGQKEVKDEISKIITLWQAGDHFRKFGGKSERGILFLGAPGTGKTMLAKAIATGFNSPIVTIPGSGFAQTFIGIDVLIVRWLVRKAKKLARKWGGQCIVFIDEIDAVGTRRGNLINGKTMNQMPGGLMGGMGSMALNQLLVAMDGIDGPPFLRRLLTNKVNLYLDALYVIPSKVWKIPLRLPSAKPRSEQVYFVGATNVPLEALDPALTRSGRMGRHIYFRTPTKNDRIDIFDLYLGKVAHDDALDTPEAREELARITSGYSPAEIEQVCSLALTYAHHSGRDSFSRADILEAMVTLEAGTALGWGYDTPEEERSSAIHEAGHAVCGHLYMTERESTRLSVRLRGRTGGHHQVADIHERFARDRNEVFSGLIWSLGAYAAEHLFYGHNTQGVAGDLRGTSYQAGLMVGRWGMVPMTSGLESSTVKKLEELGMKLLTAAGPGDIKITGSKLRDEAVWVGHAFVVAYATVRENKAAIEKIVERLLREKEIYGDDLMKLLQSCELVIPEIDWNKEETWPTL